LPSRVFVHQRGVLPNERELAILQELADDKVPTDIESTARRSADNKLLTGAKLEPMSRTCAT